MKINKIIPIIVFILTISVGIFLIYKSEIKKEIPVSRTSKASGECPDINESVDIVCGDRHISCVQKTTQQPDIGDCGDICLTNSITLIGDGCNCKDENTPTPPPQAPPTNTPTPTNTPIPTNTPTRIPTPTVTPFNIITNTPTPTPTGIIVLTNTPTPTPTPTPTTPPGVTNSPTPIPSNTPIPTATPIPPTPVPVGCGTKGCDNANNPCRSGMSCVQANDGSNYCSLTDFVNACKANPSTSTCCAPPPLTPAPLACAQKGCNTTNFPCSSGLTCIQANDGSNYCSFPEFQQTCKT
ncbi:MAG: hypothetical protein Q7R95_00780, partial [bacterium]|nr:hypothetical protein [bacterium]